MNKKVAGHGKICYDKKQKKERGMFA